MFYILQLSTFTTGGENKDTKIRSRWALDQSTAMMLKSACLSSYISHGIHLEKLSKQTYR